MRLHNVPLPRVNNLGPDNNPYLRGYTQSSLDMRRKTEILKYSANKTSSQTNLLTRKQKYALAMRGGLQPIPSNADLGSLNCPNDDYLPTPTTACNVPGPVMYLQEDPNVPLYNYSITNTRTYPDYVPNDNTQWRVATATDASFVPLKEDILFTLLIYREIENNITTYDVRVPVGIDVQGICMPGQKPANFTVSINYVVMTIYFNGNIVPVLFNGNVVSRPQSAALGNSLKMEFNVADKPTGGAFVKRQYVGNFEFLGIPLNTIYNYVYQFNFMFSVSFRTNDHDYNPANYWLNGTEPTILVIANMTTNSTKNTPIYESK